jgi:hypothetical protein
MLVAYQDWRAKRAGQVAVQRMSSPRGKTNEKVKVKA